MVPRTSGSDILAWSSKDTGWKYYATLKRSIGFHKTIVLGNKAINIGGCQRYSDLIYPIVKGPSKNSDIEIGSNSKHFTAFLFMVHRNFCIFYSNFFTSKFLIFYTNYFYTKIFAFFTPKILFFYTNFFT